MRLRPTTYEVNVDTSTYVRVNGREPQGFATWIFRRADTWEDYVFTGKYKLVRQALQPGAYTLLP